MEEVGETHCLTKRGSHVLRFCRFGGAGPRWINAYDVIEAVSLCMGGRAWESFITVS